MLFRSISRDTLFERLKANDIHARRYFYPLISSFSMYRHLPSAQPGKMPVAEDIAQRILCLPIYPDLTDEDQDRVMAVIRQYAMPAVVPAQAVCQSAGSGI